MVIQWALISAAVLPAIKKYASDRCEMLAGKYTDGIFAKAYRRLAPDDRLTKATC